MNKISLISPVSLIVLCLFVSLIASSPLAARDVEYDNKELSVFVNPNEPSQIRFPAKVAGGFKRKNSSLSLEKKGSDLMVFSGDNLREDGEAIIVRLEDGRSYSIRVRRASGENPRDAIVRIGDARELLRDPTEEPEYNRKAYGFAPASVISGLMRELILVGEFGKQSIPGYQVSEEYKGETVINDGTMIATIEKIYVGPNLWGYIINARNLLDLPQKINPASFRIDGTRAVSASRWELSPRALDLESEIAGSESSKVYIVAKAR
ncbi:MAG TPA: hypothetical protein PKD37_07090 [Oligoflexia bacterium]|nr:hypothetical protein [Oligoflexia bacterium]HMP27728.1 hypothetical protein [Oligoflexia bacterium]